MWIKTKTCYISERREYQPRILNAISSNPRDDSTARVVPLNVNTSRTHASFFLNPYPPTPDTISTTVRNDKAVGSNPF